ncbi:hypothetical protein [Streptomyces gilvosporeus]|uniref:hypothetical protein n=1 Tax=Streptomyces gilvosporeus TaxID=553510 RepID=UPI00131E66EF|nr:hypothetical protein [Streptomyces gilvosporeus]
MSAVFAPPAAVRLPRTVAARRALLAGLFLVGFVALGFAFGPGAHAADRTGAQALTGASTPAGAADGDGAERLSDSREAFTQQGDAARDQFAQHTDTASTAVTEAVRPAADRLAPVADRVTDPVTGVVHEIGTTVGGTLPVHIPSGDHTGRPGDGSAPRHGKAPAGARRAGPHGVGPAAIPAAALHPAHCTAGAHQAAPHARPALHTQRDAGHHGLPGQAPQGPVAPSSQTAGNGHGHRGGDQHAAAAAVPARFRLLPGGVRTADGAPTRRRAEDILEFPG